VSQQINLFNPVFLQQKKIFSARTMASALLLLLVGMGAIASYGSMRVASLQKQADDGAAQLSKKQARLASVITEFPPRQKSADVEAELRDLDSQLLALRNVSGVLARGELGNTQGYAEYFRALARQHVDGVWLTGLSIVGAGVDVGLRGRALDARQVPGYLNRLAQEPIMRGKSFSSLQISEGAANAPYVEFNLQSTPEGVRQ
jgi:Tfp pilus assembly protein PilN